MSPRFRSAFAAPTGFVAAVTRAKPAPGAAKVIRPAITRVVAPTPAPAENTSQRAA